MKTTKGLEIPKNVHIAVIGYEIDRIVEPLKRTGVGRFYLLINKKESRRGEKFIEILKKKIVGTNEKEGLIPPGEFKLVKIDLWDYRDIMSKLCKIINDEVNKGNNVYVNISSGSKLAAVACTLAAFIYGGNPYYVQVREYNYIKLLEEQGKDLEGLTSGVKAILEIPEYTIERPDEKLVIALSLIKNAKNNLSQKDLMKELEKIGLLKARGGENNLYIKFRRKYLEPLLANGWITTKREGKESIITLTNRGINTLKIFYDVSKSLCNIHQKD